MSLRCAAIFAALFHLSFAMQAMAQDVTLTSRDGTVEINGTLLGFDGEFYRVETQFGDLTVDGSGVSCDGPGCPNLADFVAEVSFSGSSAIAEVLMPALIEAFAQRDGYRLRRDVSEDGRIAYAFRDPDAENPLARFILRVATTDQGFRDLLDDTTDAVMALREIRPAETQLANAAGLGDLTDPNRSIVLALDAMIPVVSQQNPVRHISTPDLARVFSGSIDNWAAFGGPDAPIALHLPDAGSGLSQAAEDRLLRPLGLTPAPGILRHTRSSVLAQTVARDPFAIGLASFAETKPARALTLTGGCSFSMRATRRGIKTEDYPLTSPMFLYLPARRLPKIGREFLAYVRSPAAQAVIRQSGFVDQAPEEIAIDAQGDRFLNALLAAGPEISLEDLQSLARTVSPLSRLSLSFRFESGSARLDAQSRSNVLQLARDIDAGVYDTRRLVFVGFSDGAGSASANLSIARARAEAVRGAVLKAAETVTPLRAKLDVEAFGEALPMACDDSDWGRRANRRVEVWIR